MFITKQQVLLYFGNTQPRAKLHAPGVAVNVRRRALYADEHMATLEMHWTSCMGRAGMSRLQASSCQHGCSTLPSPSATEKALAVPRGTMPRGTPAAGQVQPACQHMCRGAQTWFECMAHCAGIAGRAGHTTPGCSSSMHMHGNSLRSAYMQYARVTISITYWQQGAIHASKLDCTDKAIAVPLAKQAAVIPLSSQGVMHAC
jgi:hypothetical protein